MSIQIVMCLAGAGELSRYMGSLAVVLGELVQVWEVKQMCKLDSLVNGRVDVCEYQQM